MVLGIARSWMAIKYYRCIGIADGSIESRDFMTGFLGDKGIVGRPVSIVENSRGPVLYH